MATIKTGLDIPGDVQFTTRIIFLKQTLSIGNLLLRQTKETGKNRVLNLASFSGNR